MPLWDNVAVRVTAELKGCNENTSLSNPTPWTPNNKGRDMIPALPLGCASTDELFARPVADSKQAAGYTKRSRRALKELTPILGEAGDVAKLL